MRQYQILCDVNAGFSYSFGVVEDLADFGGLDQIVRI